MRALMMVVVVAMMGCGGQLEPVDVQPVPAVKPAVAAYCSSGDWGELGCETPGLIRVDPAGPLPAPTPAWWNPTTCVVDCTVGAGCTATLTLGDASYFVPGTCAAR